MPQRLQIIARAICTIGLAGVAVLHVIWATGSPWPARDQERLAEAVIGAHDAMPGAVPTSAVAAGTAGTAILASGVLGDGRVQRAGLRTVGAIMLARALMGGDAALAAMGRPPAGRTFRKLDDRLYRPGTAALGICLWLSTISSRR